MNTLNSQSNSPQSYEEPFDSIEEEIDDFTPLNDSIESPISSQLPQSEQSTQSEQPTQIQPTQPLSTQPTQPLSIQTQSTQPTQTTQTTQPLSIQTQSTQPLSTQPQSTQPQSTQTQSTQPLSIQTQSTQPLSIQSQSTQPLSTQSLSEPSIDTQSDPSIDTQSDPLTSNINTVESTPEQISLYDNQQEPIEEPIEEATQEATQEPIEEPIEEPTQEVIPFIPPETEITQEELQQLEEKEKSIRSKILNQPQPCQKNQTTNKSRYIEKVQLKTPLTQTEENISKILKEHSSEFHTFLYFQPLIETNPLSIGAIKDCEQLATAEPSELIETKYKRTTTQSLTQFLQTQITQPKQNNKFIQLLVHSHLQLLNSINILQSITPPIIHFHITEQTVLYNEIDATPVLSDFRLSFTETTLNNPEERADLFPTYENYKGWPFEVFLLSQESQQQNSDETLTNLANTFAQMTQLPPPEIGVYKTDLTATYKTWDVYAVNQFIYSFMTENQIPIDEISFMTSYKELIYSYLTTSPSQRPTIPVFQENIRAIFQSVTKEEYMTFVKLLSLHQ